MRRSAGSLLLLALLALLPGCRRETPQPPQQQPTTTAQPSGPQDGGRLVRRVLADVETLNYVLQTTEEERQVLAYLYDPLIDFDQNLEPIPATAQRWEVLDEGKVYVLHIDPRATFSDGKPVRASDVIFTLNKILDEESVQFGSWFENIDRQKTAALGDHSVRVVFTKARASQLYTFNIGVLPEHVYAKENFQKTTRVVGNGPYVLKRRTRGRSIELERRSDYWRTKPHIQSIVFRPIADDAVGWKAMQRGDIDVTHLSNDQWFRVKDDPELQKKITFHNVYQLSYNCILWNLSDPLFNDVRVRRAMAMAFDRQSVIDKLYHGQARPVTGPFTPDQWAANPDVPPIDFNPQGAAALLSSAGWRDLNADGVLDRDGKRFEFELLTPAGSASTKDQALVYQQSLRDIGVRMEIRALDGSAYFEQMMKRNYQAVFTSWLNEPDPDPFGLFHSSQIPPNGLNVVGYSNPEADALMEKARGQIDRTRRTETYHLIHEIIARDQPYLFMVQVGSKWAVNKRVQNVRVARGVGLFLWYPGPSEWWVQ